MLRKLYDWTMAKAAHRHAIWWLALFAFVEASCFPIPPHPLLGLMCLAAPNKALRFAVATTLASVAGGLLGYAIGHFLYASIGDQLLTLLHLKASFPKAACYLREYGPWIIFLKGMTPIPFKLITITAGFIAMPLVPFVLASLASRAVSFMIVGVLFRLFGAPIKAWIDRYLGLATAGFVLLVVAGFAAAILLSGHGHSKTDACERATLEMPA
ncbi:MAG: DedA family protein [Sphingomonadales bacterium]|nr:DedA family protein [Sphingomonadales bacterium]